MDTLRIDRSFYRGGREYRAHWTANLQNHLWCVHFWADCVKSRDWTATSDSDLFSNISHEMRMWIKTVEIAK